MFPLRTLKVEPTRKQGEVSFLGRRSWQEASPQAASARPSTVMMEKHLSFALCSIYWKKYSWEGGQKGSWKCIFIFGPTDRGEVSALLKPLVVRFCQGPHPGAGQTCWASVWKSTAEAPQAVAQRSGPPGPDQQVCREKPGTAAGHRSQQPPHVWEYRVRPEGEASSGIIGNELNISYWLYVSKRCTEKHQDPYFQLFTFAS